MVEYVNSIPSGGERIVVVRSIKGRSYRYELKLHPKSKSVAIEEEAMGFKGTNKYPQGHPQFFLGPVE
jgi:hypothetical protein